MYLETAAAMIKRHEGLRLRLYECSAGKTTIGYGRNLDDNGISHSEAEYMLEADIELVDQQLGNCAWFSGLNDARESGNDGHVF